MIKNPGHQVQVIRQGLLRGVNQRTEDKNVESFVHSNDFTQCEDYLDYNRLFFFSSMYISNAVIPLIINLMNK